MIRTIVTQVIEMAALRRRLGLVVRAVTEFPADLVVALVYALLSGALLLSPVVFSTWIMAIIAIPFLFVLPGFVFLAVLFPRRATKTNTDAEGPVFTLHTRSIDGVERAILSFGMSVVLVPILGFGYSLFPIGYSRQAVAGTILGFVLVAIALGAIQRARVPPEERYRLPIKQSITSGRRALAGVPRVDAALNVLLAIAMVVAVSTVAYAVVNPLDGTQYTEVSLMTETDSGEFVAGNYPDDFVRGDSQPLTVSITNREDARQTYDVVVVVQRVRDGGESPTVLEQRRVDDFRLTVGAGETTRLQHAAQSPISGENLRLVYLVYDGTPPDRPTTENAYRYVHLWIDVREPA
jgi:uncharacterized membrane protein